MEQERDWRRGILVFLNTLVDEINDVKMMIF